MVAAAMVGEGSKHGHRTIKYHLEVAMTHIHGGEVAAKIGEGRSREEVTAQEKRRTKWW
jgi:hypothetical protein